MDMPVWVTRRRPGGQERRGHRLGDPEIGDDRRPVRQEHVVGLDVAVDHAVGVGVAQGPRDVAKDAHRLGDGERRLLADPAAQRLAGDERHGVVRHPGGVPGREERDDVGLLKRRRQLDLPLETIQAHLGRDVGREHLDDDLAAQPLLPREENARHPAAAELALDLIAAAEGGSERLEVGRHGISVRVGTPQYRRRTPTEPAAPPVATFPGRPAR